MRLQLDASLGREYKSASQWARRVTEGWAKENLYCLACPSGSLSAHVANRAVEDFYCPACARRIQLKSKNGRIGATVSNSAYTKKVTAILAGRAPDYYFLSYDKGELRVDELLCVPGHFLTLSVISKRRPLKATARRAGWIGSNIHLDLLPARGKIPLVIDGRVVPVKETRRQFRELEFVKELPVERRGWLMDVLACLDTIGLRRGSSFANADVYGCEDWLLTLHPQNKNIRPKIRQQLQVLASYGQVERVSPGVYRRL